MSRIRNPPLRYENEITHPQEADAAAPLMTGHLPLWDAPVAFLLASLEEAGVRVVERRFEVGQTIYVRGNPSRHLYFVIDGVIKLYKGYREHKEAIVTLLEKGNVFGEPTLRLEDVHSDSAEAAAACRVTLVGKEALAQHVQRDPRCAIALTVAYAQWVQRNARAMERLIPRDIRPRLAISLESVSPFSTVIRDTSTPSDSR